MVPATSPPGSFFFTVTRVGTRYGCLLREQHGCMMTSGLCMRCLVIQTSSRILAQKSNEKDLEKKIQNKFVEGETSRKWSAGAGKRYELANSVSFLFIFCFFSCIFYFLFCAQSLEGNSNGGNLQTGWTFFFRLASVFFPSIFLIQKQEVTATARATEAGAEANPHE